MPPDAVLRALSAIANPTRYAIVERLQEHGTLTPTQLQELIGVPRNLVSSHLAVLSGAGLVRPGRPDRDGRAVPYEVVAATLTELGGHLEKVAARR